MGSGWTQAKQQLVLSGCVGMPREHIRGNEGGFYGLEVSTPVINDHIALKASLVKDTSRTLISLLTSIAFACILRPDKNTFPSKSQLHHPLHRLE